MQVLIQKRQKKAADDKKSEKDCVIEQQNKISNKMIAPRLINEI